MSFGAGFWLIALVAIAVVAVLMPPRRKPRETCDDCGVKLLPDEKSVGTCRGCYYRGGE